MGRVALVLFKLDEIDGIRRDTELGQKTADVLSTLNQRSRNQIAIGNSATTVMSTDGNDIAFVRVVGNTAKRLTSEEEAAVAKTLSRLGKKNKRNASLKIVSRE